MDTRRAEAASRRNRLTHEIREPACFSFEFSVLSFGFE